MNLPSISDGSDTVRPTSGHRPVNTRGGERNVERIPVEAAQLGQSGRPSLRLTLRRLHDNRPARGVKARHALHWRTMVTFHKEVGL